jgi:N-methylhydantoinase A
MTTLRRPAAAPTMVGVDVGGTFTDAVLVHDGRLTTAKIPTTVDDQSDAVVAAVLLAAERAGLGAGDIVRFIHGMTVGTNALLEGTGARTCLVTTAGFGDLLHLRRQTRAHLYRLDAHHPAALIPHERTHEVIERCGPDGVITPLDHESLGEAIEAVRADDAEAVALGFLFSFAHPAHERLAAEALRDALPGVHVSASCEVLPEFREYERLSTTAVDAYLTPVLHRYLHRLAERAEAAGLPAPAIMQSSGGVLPIADSAEHAAWTVLSGPAGGVIGAAQAASGRGAGLVLTFDMGGTSCDVALVRDGHPARTTQTEIAGHPLHLPMLDVATVSAGGGSIAWADSGGALRVGPESARAVPGPAAYGLGGTRPTVTDANVVLGRIPVDEPLGGRITLDVAAARGAVGELARTLGLGLEDCAEGILTVAVQEMVRALRRVSVERGVDPREATLVAFGGAGPLHACQVADELGIGRVVVPAAAGLLAALGLVIAGERRDYVQTVLLAAGGGLLADRLLPLVRRARAELPDADLSAQADCRYLGQRHALTVAWDPDAPEEDLARDFHRAHMERYGENDPGREVEVVSLRLAAERPGVDPRLPAPTPGPARRGPAVIAADGATCWVPAGWSARSEGPGGLVLRRA